ncbi:DUF3127 domain-containing protein [Flavobacterium muglaense]|uniref:DUF3127 domain-containing protein n=1 Tax=Flavobacterium muglaense TaxID=2764716 RepID=A0A923SFD0_9FLAO|nr:DUF3127 domain-containing protein [Flavobacterium muglaense]MBC5837972.1 DUF3127 domain-containing protein [Flavobacterium muglaense]MBC5844466.1 DUF3127 domain-containing protein [Flavobacterium muglaense]
MEVTGKIKVVNPEQQVSASFKKRELVVTTDEQYPQHIMIEFTQDKCDLLNSYAIGEPVKVSINLRGREWVNPQGETRYFNSIQGWRIEKAGVEQAPAGTPPMPAAQAFAPATNLNEDEPDDLPF